MNYDSSQKLNMMHPEQKKALAAGLASPNQKANPFAAAGAPRPPGDNIRELLNAAPPRRTTSDGGLPNFAGTGMPRPSAAAPGGVPAFTVERFDSANGRGGTRLVPNMEYGRLHGLEWSGKEWVKADPFEDLQREGMELEIEQRRQQMEMERKKFDLDSSGTPDLRSWLQSRMERK